MTLRHLKIFLAVATYNTMREAAAKLYISQPTISQAIADLESEYGTRLFERFPRRLYLTPAGKQLLRHANCVLTAVEDLEQAMKLSSSASIWIGASVTVGTCLLESVIQDLEKHLPNVESYVTINNTATIEEELLHNHLDIAIVEGKIKSTELVFSPIAEDRLVLICGNAHPFVKKKQISLKDLEGQPFVLRENGSGTRELFESNMKEQQFPINVKWTSSNSEAIVQAVINNRGLSVMSSRLIQEKLKQGLLQEINVVGCQWIRTFHLVYHKNKYMTPLLQQFIESAKRVIH